jgi:uncharacterized protein YkwD
MYRGRSRCKAHKLETMKIAIRLLVIVPVAFAVGFLGAAFALSRLNAETRPEEQTPDKFIQDVVVLTNAQRAVHALPPLKLQHDLKEAAIWLARDMAEKSYLAHTDSSGRDFASRVQNFGYADASDLAENLARGVASPEMVLKEWMKSEQHQANVLNPNVREIGIGYAGSGRGVGQDYWVADFGSRLTAYPVVINNEAIRTISPEVDLYIYGCPAQGLKTKTMQNRRSERPCQWQMRLSNNGQTWTAWESYRSTRRWTLMPGTGMRQVFVELRGDGRLYKAKDTIELTPETGTAGAMTEPRKPLRVTRFLP